MALEIRAVICSRKDLCYIVYWKATRSSDEDLRGFELRL